MSLPEFYWFPISINARLVHYFAEASGIELDRKLVNLTEGAHKQPSYLELFPTGVVPGLVDDGQCIYESSTIVRYLALKFESDLYPINDLKLFGKVETAYETLRSDVWNKISKYSYLSSSLVEKPAEEEVAKMKADIDTNFKFINNLWFQESPLYAIGTELTIVDIALAVLLTQLRLLEQDVIEGADQLNNWWIAHQHSAGFKRAHTGILDNFGFTLSDKKVVTVVGATGQQGGSVVNYLLESGNYVVRAITRDNTTEKSRALSARGAIVLEGDVNVKESLIPSFEGSDVVFGVTFFEYNSDNDEYQQGKNIADAALEAGVSHYIFSDLVSPAHLSNEELVVQHFDDKWKAAEYASELGFDRFTRVRAPFYINNLLNPYFGVKSEGDSLKYAFPVPDDTKIPVIDVAEYGFFVRYAIENEIEYETLNVVGQMVNAEDIRTALNNVSSVPVEVLVTDPLEMVSVLGEDIANMFIHFHKHGYFGDESTELSQSIFEATDIEEVFRKNWILSPIK
eukprot:TRINITY_DN4548_c0_g1_i1.p1 TRINITY_DN4548_c0_g1~~TRINITY_DN4548_c0_g1_i1.p1  ORF type:complete len:512 (-),score=124.89 TRINITY_DN4548_c0_g1_i1:180-1715(-)